MRDHAWEGRRLGGRPANHATRGGTQIAQPRSGAAGQNASAAKIDRQAILLSETLAKAIWGINIS